MPATLTDADISRLDAKAPLTDAQIAAHDSAAQLPGAKAQGSVTATGNPAADFAAGAGGELAKHLLGAYHLIRMIPGVGEHLPEPNDFVNSLANTPDTVPGKVGKFAEQVAEYAIPSSAAEEAMVGAGRLARMAAQGGIGGGVAAVQSGGDTTSTAVSAGLGAAGVPIGDLLGWIGGKILDPKSLYQSALKPTRTMMEDNPGIIDAGLSAKLPVSPSSLAKIHAGIQDLRDQINQGVSGGTNAGGTVDPHKVVDALDELRSIYENSANHNLGGGVKAIDRVKEEFLKAHGMAPATIAPASTILGPNGQPAIATAVVPATSASPMSLDAAQQAKINTHILLRDAYGDMKGAEVEATKQMARGLKEQIEAVFPEIANLNQKQSQMMGLDEAMSRAVWKLENRDMLPIGSSVAAIGGHAIGGAPGAAVGLVAKTLDSIPELKSRLAIALASRGVKNAGQFITDRIGNMISATQAATTQDFTPPGTAGLIQ